MEKCKERCISSTLMPLYRTAKFRAKLLYSNESFDFILAKVEAIFSFHTRLSIQRMLDIILKNFFILSTKINDDWLNDQLDLHSILFKFETALNFYSWNYSFTDQDQIFCFTKYLLLICPPLKNPLLKYLPLKSYILAQSFLSFTVICTFKLSILLYSKTAHEGKKHVKYMFCSNMYIQNVYFFVF